MILKRFFLFGLLFLVCGINLFSQTSPYISRLKVTEEESSIMLTWRDPRNVEGSILVYRHFEVISDVNFANAYLAGEVNMGVQVFSDIPPADTPLFYAVLVKTVDGIVERVFIEQRNITNEPVILLDRTPETELAARVTNLKAEISGNSVILRFETDKQDRELLVYRGIEPVFSAAQLVGATSLKLIDSNTRFFRDYPVEGIPYYYAIIDAGLVRIGLIELQPEVNTLKMPVEIPINSTNGHAYFSSSIRSQPLPELILREEIESGNQLTSSLTQILPKYQPLSPETEKAVITLSGTQLKKELPLLTPVILDKDRINTGKGDEYVLNKILNDSFLNQDWSRAEKDLAEFLRLRAFSEIEDRTRFYLGQTLYFQTFYRRAFMELLSAQDKYYTDVTPWLEDILVRLNTTGN